MFKKLKERKGFTLAELLVVIAILAILIAIAIPVFSHMVAEANLRVNQANVHSTKSAAVTKILTNMDKNDDRTSGTKSMNAGIIKPDDTEQVAKRKGWIALADVDNAGNITNLRVYACDGTNENSMNVNYYADAIYTADKNVGNIVKAGTNNDSNYYQMPKKVDTDNKFATVKPTSKKRETYTVQAIIHDIDLTAK